MVGLHIFNSELREEGICEQGLNESNRVTITLDGVGLVRDLSNGLDIPQEG